MKVEEESRANNDDEIQENRECFDEHESMEDKNDDIGDLCDYLIPNEGPYYVNEEEERSNERSYYQAIGEIWRKARVLEHKRRIQESLLILTTNTPYHSRHIRRIPRLRRIQDHCLTLKNTPTDPTDDFLILLNLFTCDTPLGMNFDELSRLNGMNDDFFAYEVKIP
ncbi:hypothetical protein Tco_0687470 [Tanacetum coccineum]